MPIDYSIYPHNWKSEIVPRILHRAGDRCENCRIANGITVFSIPMWIKHETSTSTRYKIKRIWTTDYGCVDRLTTQGVVSGEVKEVRVVLTIAHLDHDETNHDVTDDRLAAWCQSCHLNYDAKEKYRRKCAPDPPEKE